jgi:hypothetical protein
MGFKCRAMPKINSAIILFLLSLLFFTVGCLDNNSKPQITSFTPSSGKAGDTVTITGKHFSTTAADNTVKFNGTTATVTSATSTQIVTAVPAGATTGPITVTVKNKTATSSSNFTVTGLPTITSFTPASGLVSDPVTITGTNFSTTAANNTVKFNGTTATVTSATATQIVTSVPTGATTGTISVTVNGYTATSSSSFTVVFPPTITSFTPGSGLVGATVTITGTNFSTTATNNTVKFNGTTTNVTSATATQIVTSVPTGATTGKITVTVGGNTATSSTDFTVTVIAGEVPTVAGFYNDGGNDMPCYWTGGTDITPIINADVTRDAYAYSPAVTYNGTVYTAGYYYTYISQYYYGYRACYWEGQTRIDLTTLDDSIDARAYAIAVDGGTVYVAGFYNDGTKEIPCYWTRPAGGSLTRTTLSGDSVLSYKYARAMTITVDGGTVYVAGFYYDSTAGHETACYWRGNTRQELTFPDGTWDSYANSITVSNGTVYIAGQYYLNATNYNRNIGCYWTNPVAGGTPSRQDVDTVGNDSAYPYSITVSDGTVYMAGSHWNLSLGDVPCYWIGTALTNLTVPSSSYGEAGIIVISGGTIYTAGYYYGSDDISVPCYWTGTVRTNLPKPSSAEDSGVQSPGLEW